jgi:NAD(H)-dependent 7beta-hydroxy-3-oxo-delta4-cholenoic acid oxidoreductase
MKQLKKLFSPIKIGSVEIRNRIAMAPMETGSGCDDGTIPDKLVHYYEARAKGGVGLIILEVAMVDRRHVMYPNGAGLWDDKNIASFKRLSDAVHTHGAKLFPQIAHPGPDALSFLLENQPMAPSVIVSSSTRQVSREMTLEDIRGVTEQFGEAARRAREAGCDGMELHAAHSILMVGSFLSPLRNRRTDAYGGSLEGRLRFCIEVIRQIKARAGKDFPIALRISGDDMMPGGRTIEETQCIAPILAEAGVDAFHISSGVVPLVNWRVVPPTGTPLGLNRHLSAAVKQVVKVPVLVVGRINDPVVAEDILEKDQADMVVMGRALLADPDLPNKAREGRLDDITPCVGCSLGCFTRLLSLQPLTCINNPAVLREREMALIKAAKAKKVLVAGGGPAGLEAARVAALRGHDVTLFEKEARLGGQYNLAAVPPLKQELSKTIRYLSMQVQKAGVKVELNAEVTPDLVAKYSPDVVVVATGGAPLIPDIPGVHGQKVVTAHDVLAGRVIIPGGNVLVIGGGMVGLEVADYLADLGDNPWIGCTNVTVLEMMDAVGADMSGESRAVLLPRLRSKGVKMITSTKVKEILPDGVKAVNTVKEVRPDFSTAYKEGDKETVISGIDTLILAAGARSVDPLSEKLKGQVGEVYVIGDARQARKALEAIAEGAEVGRKI